MTGKPQSNPFWSLSAQQHFQQLNSSQQGLSSDDAQARLKQYGPNQLNHKKPNTVLRLLLAQFKSSIILLLLFATGISFYLNDHVDALIILSIVLISGLLGFWQEKGAADAVEQLLALVEIKVSVWRDQVVCEMPAKQLVPGDVIVLKAGDIVPADCLLISADNLFVDEAALTGESYPAEKNPAELAINTALSQRSNALWMGTHVQSGSAQALVIATGETTEFGKLSTRIKLKTPETEFERGVRRFGYLLMEVTLVLVMIIFAVNVYLHKPVLDSFLFALALPVGLTPQLLPAIISVNLAHGARRMLAEKVIVKQLASIENLGSMNVLCSDKTGTLTEGTVQVHGAFDVLGNGCQRISRYAYLNAVYETGFNNPIDNAIRAFKSFDLADSHKLDEIPYDFHRKILSMCVVDQQQTLLISKGALTNVLAVCSHVENPDGSLVAIEQAEAGILQAYQNYSCQGLRTLGLAYKPLAAAQTHIDKNQESQMRFLGFLTFSTRQKPIASKPLANCGNWV